MTSYPVFITCRDRLTPLLSLIAWLERVRQFEIYLLDNDSVFPPLVQYYRETKHQVIYLGANLGPYALWNARLLETLNVTGPFILSDPDVVPTEDCPDDAIDVLADVLDRFPDRVKVGFGLQIDDLPDHYPRKAEVLAFERQYWETQLAPGLYDANIDTTFALYRPGLPFAYGPSIRTGPPYLARHVPWYTNPAYISDDDKVYFERASAFTNWSLHLPGSRAASADQLTALSRESRDAGQGTVRILEATYGTRDSAVDVIAQLQEFARKGCLPLSVSNSLFGDPCPYQLKTLRFTYQLPEDDRHYTDEVPEHQLVLLPDPGTGKNLQVPV